MQQKVQDLFRKMCDKDEAEAFVYADQLAKIGSEEVLSKLLELLRSEDFDDAYLAARALSKMENNQAALEPLLEVIHAKSNQNRNGGFVEMLEGFDLSDSFVDLFRIYLFGNFKASLLAKALLDSVEFDITPRVLKKAEKHWKHFTNNTNAESDEFMLKKDEVETMLQEMRDLFDDNQ